MKIVVAGRPAENLVGIDIKGRNKLVANSAAQVCRLSEELGNLLFLDGSSTASPPQPLLRVITAKQRKS